MKIFSLLACVAGLASASIDVDDGTISQRVRFEAWMKKHQTVFENEELPTGDKFTKVWSAWVDNDKMIQEVNAKGLSYKLGHNRFSHMTSEEFASRYGGGLSKSDMHTDNETVDWTLADPVRQAAAPSSVDWVAAGVVTTPKDQGICHSCWAFSVTGALESAFKIAGHNLIPFSEDQLVECDTRDSGCSGGHYRTAFRYVQSQGLCTESDYPYGARTRNHGVVDQCRTSCQSLVTISGYSNVAAFDENSLKVAVAQQPVNVAVDGENSQWQFYKSGVVDSSFCSQSVNHAVLAVGYGTDSKDYWKIKNSWGPEWGEAGYIRLKRGDNTCGVGSMPSYPTGVVNTRTVPASDHHYGDPSAGKCLDDETVLSLGSIPGQICSPGCGNRDCPTDLPSDMDATPLCATNGGEHVCALVCTSSSQCGQASCRDIGRSDGIGLCTYDSSFNVDQLTFSFNQSTSVLFK